MPTYVGPRLGACTGPATDYGPHRTLTHTPEIANLKQQKGKDLLVFGSRTLMQ